MEQLGESAGIINSLLKAIVQIHEAGRKTTQTRGRVWLEPINYMRPHLTHRNSDEKSSYGFKWHI